jgi:hypothetical protein
MPGFPIPESLHGDPKIFRASSCSQAERFTPRPGVAEGFTTRSPRCPQAVTLTRCKLGVI